MDNQLLEINASMKLPGEKYYYLTEAGMDELANPNSQMSQQLKFFSENDDRPILFKLTIRNEKGVILQKIECEFGSEFYCEVMTLIAKKSMREQ